MAPASPRQDESLNHPSTSPRRRRGEQEPRPAGDLVSARSRLFRRARACRGPGDGPGARVLPRFTTAAEADQAKAASQTTPSSNSTVRLGVVTHSGARQTPLMRLVLVETTHEREACLPPQPRKLGTVQQPGVPPLVVVHQALRTCRAARGLATHQRHAGDRAPRQHHRSGASPAAARRKGDQALAEVPSQQGVGRRPLWRSDLVAITGGGGEQSALVNGSVVT
jgi:hypothetical protein